jgi:hypothetical protein
VGMNAWETVVVNKYVPQLRIGLHLLLYNGSSTVTELSYILDYHPVGSPCQIPIPLVYPLHLISIGWSLLACLKHLKYSSGFGRYSVWRTTCAVTTEE